MAINIARQYIAALRANKMAKIVVIYGWLKIHPKIPTVIEGNHVSPLFDQPSSNITCISNASFHFLAKYGNQKFQTVS